MLPLEEELFHAIERQDFSTVKKIIRLIKDLHSIYSDDNVILPSLEAHDEKNGETPLIKACRKGDLHIIKILLHAGAQIDGRARNQSTPLMFAAQKGEFACVKFLIEVGAEVDAKGQDGNTALMWAASYNQQSCLQLLLKFKANPTLTNNDGLMPFEVARKKGHAECSRLLSEWTPLLPLEKLLITALEKNNFELFDETVKRIKEVQAKYANYPEAKSNVKLPSFDRIYYKNKTPLILVAQQSNPNFLITLLKEKIDLNINVNGTALGWALFTKNENNAVALLNTAGVNVVISDDQGNSPLHHAVMFSPTCTKLLLFNEQVAVNALNISSDTPLMCAVRMQNIDCVKLLLARADVDIDHKNSFGKTALRIAVENGDDALCALLLSHGAKKDDSLLGYAKTNGHHACVKLLADEKQQTKKPSRLSKYYHRVLFTLRPETQYRHLNQTASPADDSSTMDLPLMPGK